MNYSNYSFTLNLQIHQSQISIPVSLNDTARKLYITFIDGRKPYRIPDGCRAVFVGFKSDETTLFNDCIIQENKTVIYEFTEQTANVEGVVNCEIRLYGEDGKQLTSSQFIMIVDENDTRDISLSENESTAIDSIIHAEIGRVEAESEREAAEKSRKELAGFLATSGGVIVSDEEPKEGLANVWVDDSPEKEEIRLLDSTDIAQELAEDDEKIPSVALLKKSLDEIETGANGKDGLTPYIKDGNWWIGETDTGVKAEGKDGKDGINGKDGENGKDGTNGIDGKNGADGKNGTDGKTPYIQDGYWYIDGANTNVKAQGENGKDGAKGDKGDQGEKGDKGDAGADGKDGANGTNGKDGVSATHSWNGTTLTITSASGTSSADLKGENGADGKDGKDGANGKDYVLTSTDKTEIAEQAVKLIDGVPDYVKNEAESVIDRVLSAQGNKTFTFAVMTDMHYGNGNYTDGIKHACQALKYIDERVKLDTIVILGDYTDGYPTTNIADAMMDFKGINAMLDKLRFAPNLRQMGNHDYYADNIPITRRLIQYYSDDVVWGSKIGGYFYKDFDDYNIRAICINTIENDNSNISVSKQQYEWFINSLDLSQKENATDWQIVILSHHPLDWWVVDSNYRFGQIINAYKNGSSFNDTEISCDFSGKNSAVLVANIHGHIHNLLTDTIYFTNKNNTEKTSVYRLCTPNACYGRENQYDGWNENTTYPKTQNSAKDTAFVIYCVNLDTHIIKAICYGAGYDRELDYINGISTISYSIEYNLTNVTSSNVSVKIQSGESYSTTLSSGGDIKSVIVTMNGIDITSSAYKNGSITIDSVTGNVIITAVAEEIEKIVNLLDTVGYTDGIRFSGSNGVEKEESICMATGYIDVSGFKSGDHIYGWGVDFNNSNNSGKCVIVSYDANKNILGQALLNQDSKIANLKVSFDAENRLDISYNGTPIATYIRFSGVGTGANAVVTKNQLPID